MREAGWWAFERLTDLYDRWFDTEKGSRIFRVEVECLRDLLVGMPPPWLEVGVGTGRFAEALHVDDGVDPSPAAIEYAARRGVRVKRGAGESLPYGDGTFGVVLLVVTICFLDSPVRTLSECRRVLGPEGRLIIGLVPKDSPWGRACERKGTQGHAFYSAAMFHTCGETIGMAEETGFRLEDSRSCLIEDPEAEVGVYEKSKPAIVAGAGFVGMRFRAMMDPDWGREHVHGRLRRVSRGAVPAMFGPVIAPLVGRGHRQADDSPARDGGGGGKTGFRPGERATGEAAR